jgi:ribosome-binding factor A
MARKPLEGLTAPSGVKRSVRVAERVREEISVAIARHLRDPRVVNAVVTRVEVTDDLQQARVLVRLSGAETGDDAGARRRLLAGLTAASGSLRKLVGENLGLRRSPELKFFYDEGVDASDRVSALLAEIARDESEKK